MQVLNKNTQFIFNDKPNLAKKATEDKTIKSEKTLQTANPMINYHLGFLISLKRGLTL